MTPIENRVLGTLGVIGRNLRAKNILVYNDVGSRPGLSSVVAAWLRVPGPEGAKQKSPGRKPWVWGWKAEEP